MLASTLAEPRRGHLAFLLPNDNTVLIAGGRLGDLELYSAELYIPWTGASQSTGDMAEPRSEATGAPTSLDGLPLVGGGANSVSGTLATSELYGFATVKTDKDDYAPGETVTITGNGWEAGEQVTLLLQEDVNPPFHDDRTLAAVADASGNILNNEYSPTWGPPQTAGSHAECGSVWCKRLRPDRCRESGLLRDVEAGHFERRWGSGILQREWGRYPVAADYRSRQGGTKYSPSGCGS